MGEIMITEITEENIKAVYQLICQLENEIFDFELFQQRFYQNIENKTCFMYGYFMDQTLVGFISFYIKEYLHHQNKTAEIAELIVDENYRSQKIGEKLIRHIIKQANALKLEELELCTNIKRNDAHRFYKKQGFIMDHYNFIKKTSN